ncbi:acylamino-acid-releasing enzyme-like [Liolophura sinensis]|uniref:acylamino-acid-releasing enzyme-like n=1 Tax=Liolophura sinensis TaxID=3198878 RepID=UPI003158C17B
MVVTKVENVVCLYRDYASFPSPVSARITSISDKTTHVSAVWSQRDLERKENVKFSKTYFVPGEGAKDVISTAPQEIKNEIWNELSPSGKLKAIVRDAKTKKGDEKQFVEIWDDNHKLKTVDVTAIDKHGKIYEAGGFGSLTWSLSEEKLLYTAEMKPARTASYFDTITVTGNETSEVIQGDEFVFRESWGEQMIKCSHPVLCVLDWKTSDIMVLEGIPDDLSPGQAVWAPGDQAVAFVGWCHDPWRLGLTYCVQRKSHLYLLDLGGKSCKKLSADNWACRSPRNSPDHSKLIYLQVKTAFTHYQCSRLVMFDWKTQKNTVVVDIVNSNKDKVFQGLFLIQLPSRCWCADSKRVLLDSFTRSNKFVYVVNLESKEVTALPGEEAQGDWVVHDVLGNKVIAQYSSLDTPPYLVMGDIPPAGQESSIKWNKLSQSVKLSEITWKIIKFNPAHDNENEKFPDVDYEGILVLPTGSKQEALPLVVFPHGGPHTCFSSGFALYFSLLARCGFAVLLVNYRGSVGFGQDGIVSLVGNIGKQDVQDVQSATLHVLKSDFLDKEKVVVMGGSHGGFLTTHLIGHYPGFYKAAVARNPVTNLVAMLGSSDIPDWIYVECGYEFDFVNLPNPDMYKTFWSKSPIRYIDQVKTPTMIMLGAEDKRVPPKQGEEYYRALKARNIPARLLVYPEDCHPIIKMDSESDAFVNIIRWFSDHL